MTYWKNRIKKEIEAKQKAEYSLDVRMQNMYDHYIGEVEKEINDFYTRYAVRESISVSEAKKRVSEMDVQAFSDKAKRYVKEKNFSDEANKELALYNLKMKISRLQLLQYNIDLQLLGLSDEETKLAEEYLNQEYKQEIKSQAGIMSEFVNNPKEVKTSMYEILDKPFHGVTWKTGLREQQEAIRKVVAKATEDLLIKGKNPTTYISKLTKDMKIKRYEAKRLLVTEGARLQTEVQKATYLENDFEEYEFMAESTACKICSALDGKIFKVEDMQAGTNACPMHPHCHCSTAPHLDREKALEKAKAIRNGKIDVDFDGKISYNKSMNRDKNPNKRRGVSITRQNKLTEEFRKNGGTVWQGATATEYLDKVNAAACCFNADVIVLRERPTISEILEELYHAQQHRNGEIDTGSRVSIVKAEIKAQQYLLSVTEKYKIPESEVKHTKRNLKDYQQELKELQKNEK